MVSLRTRLFQAVVIIVLLCIGLTLGLGLLLTRKAVDKATLDEIKICLQKIEAALAKTGTGRIALSPPTVGRIHLVNMYAEEMLFVINGKGYRVAPFTSAMLDNQPVGMFKYEVISGTYGLRASNTPTLAPGPRMLVTWGTVWPFICSMISESSTGPQPYGLRYQAPT